MVYHTLTMTEKQEKLMLETAKRFGCDNVLDFINKSIELSSFVSEITSDGFDIYAVDPKNTKVYKKEKQTMILAENSKSIVSINHHIDNITMIKKQIKATNAFGLPIDSIENC